MFKPIPIPSSLVVKNGVNRLPAMSAAMPEPLSATRTSA